MEGGGSVWIPEPRAGIKEGREPGHFGTMVTGALKDQD